MKLEGRTALVTGANRGLGKHLAQQLVARGVTVYAGARNPGSVDVEGVIPVALDVTDPESVAAAAAATENVSILINNAGIFVGGSLLTVPLEDVRKELEVNYVGPLLVTQAFAPQLAAQGTSAVVNVLSALSWLVFPDYAGYSASKSAAWALTNGLRLELADQGTQVAAVHVGYMDTDMVAGVDAPKLDPATAAKLLLDGLEADSPEILLDEVSTQVQAGLAGGVAALYPQFA